MKKIIVILISLFIIQSAYCQYKPEVITVRKEVNEERIYTLAQSPPLYPGGDTAMNNYMGRNIRYPEGARNAGIQGIVYCQFIVEKNGSITGEKIVRSPDPEFDPIVLNAIRKMPKWNPGLQRGKAVRVQFVIPVRFFVR